MKIKGLIQNGCNLSPNRKPTWSSSWTSELSGFWNVRWQTLQVVLKSPGKRSKKHRKWLQPLLLLLPQKPNCSESLREYQGTVPNSKCVCFCFFVFFRKVKIHVEADGLDWPVCGGRRLQDVLTLWLRPSASGLGSGLRGTDRKWLRLMGWVWLWARQGRLRRDGFRLFSFRISLMLVCMPAGQEGRVRESKWIVRLKSDFFKFMYCSFCRRLLAWKKKWKRLHLAGYAVESLPRKEMLNLDDTSRGLRRDTRSINCQSLQPRMTDGLRRCGSPERGNGHSDFMKVK